MGQIHVNVLIESTGVRESLVDSVFCLEMDYLAPGVLTPVQHYEADKLKIRTTEINQEYEVDYSQVTIRPLSYRFNFELITDGSDLLPPYLHLCILYNAWASGQLDVVLRERYGISHDSV
jgi:hypothetical protein